MRPVPAKKNTIQIPILAAGNGWLAMDKPAGISVHNESGNDLCSLAAAMIRQNKVLGGRIEIHEDL
jgi:hypothetical protein